MQPARARAAALQRAPCPHPRPRAPVIPAPSRPLPASPWRGTAPVPHRPRRAGASRRTASSVRAAGRGGGAALTPPFNVVVTGATKGVGLALAQEFVRAGDSVAVCSRDAGRVAAAVAALSALAAEGGGAARVVGRAVNVARPAEVAAFADYAAAELGSVDLWINNAGSNGYAFGPLMDQAEEDLVAIVETNVLGTLLGCREAIRVMRTQRGGGHVFNMDGAGADGGATPRFAAYGATKRSLEQLGKSLRSELRAAGVGNVGVHNLSPGMVTTQLLMAGADTRVARFFINVLAEEPATVAAALVPRMRAAPAEARTPLGAIAGGSYIRFLTKPRAYAQIIKRLVRGERKDRYVSED